MNARNWIDIEPGNYSLSAFEVAKKVTYLLRNPQQVHREEDGAVHFWSKNLQSQFHTLLSDLTGGGMYAWQEED